jgi:hypothetical protein
MRRRFVTETFCRGDVLLGDFLYVRHGDTVPLRRRTDRSASPATVLVKPAAICTKLCTVIRGMYCAMGLVPATVVSLPKYQLLLPYFGAVVPFYWLNDNETGQKPLWIC